MEFQIKKCKTCNESYIASLHNFHKAIGNKDNIQTICKSCQKVRDKAIRTLPGYNLKKAKHWKKWAKNNPEKVKTNSKAKQKRYTETLPDNYIKRLLIREMKDQYGISVSRIDISKELVIEKRNKILFYRKVKQCVK